MLTTIILVITIIISWICFSNPQIFKALSLYPYRCIHNHEWYRLLTHGFVHANWTHLFVNMFVLWSFGNNVEAIFNHIGFGKGLFLVLYFGGIIVSSIVDIIRYRNNSHYDSIGASGAVSAVIFSSIFFNPWSNILFFAIIPIPGIIFGIIYLVYCQYMARQAKDNVNHNAHFYGAIYGFLFPIIIRPQLIELFIQQFGR